MKEYSYETTKEIIENFYPNNFSLNKITGLIHFNKEIFEIGLFRKEVFEKHGELLDNDKYILEIASQVASNNKFSPLEDYLNKCFDQNKDINCKSVFDELTEKSLHLDSKSLEAKYVVKTLVGAVSRVFEPGCKFDTVLVFVGKQGLYKTTFFETLAGSENFTTVHLGRFDKDEKMICQSKWIIELGECESSINKREMGKLKAFITETSSTYRIPYDKNPVTVPRTFILVGSSNRNDFLIDETGNRRFWCVDIEKKIDLDWVKHNRGLIWAAAVQAYSDPV